jgi:hypothetical protein
LLAACELQMPLLLLQKGSPLLRKLNTSVTCVLLFLLQLWQPRTVHAATEPASAPTPSSECPEAVQPSWGYAA